MPSYAKATVLTVEDDPIVRADLRLILEDAGFEVCAEARDGYEALSQAREHRPDLILLDLGLPRLGGVEATRLILDERPVPIVALTGYANVEAHRDAIDAGAADVVLKPFSERDLVGRLRAALDTEDAVATQPLATADSDTNYRLHVLVEDLVRKGHSQREIERELRLVTGEPGTTVSLITAAIHWLRRKA
jgi:two-component system, response regulator PdtaR